MLIYFYFAGCADLMALDFTLFRDPVAGGTVMMRTLKLDGGG